MSTQTEHLADQINALVEPWSEVVEYVAPVITHSPSCQDVRREAGVYRAMHMMCTCPIKAEQRRERVIQQPLIAQLECEASGYAPTTMGARGGKPTSRPPASLDMLDLLQSIDQFLIAQGAEGKTRVDRLRNLVSTSMNANDDEWTKYASIRIKRFIKTARIMLNYDVPKRVLRDVVCGTCKSALVVAIDATSDVVCVGDGCKTRYRRYEWVDLLDQ